MHTHQLLVFCICGCICILYLWRTCSATRQQPGLWMPSSRALQGRKMLHIVTFRASGDHPPSSWDRFQENISRPDQNFKKLNVYMIEFFEDCWQPEVDNLWGIPETSMHKHALKPTLSCVPSVPNVPTVWAPQYPVCPEYLQYAQYTQYAQCPDYTEHPVHPVHPVRPVSLD